MCDLCGVVTLQTTPFFMFNLNESNKFYLWRHWVDLRKGFNGLDGLVRQVCRNPVDGAVYVFLNKSRDTLKLLHWERGGYVVYHKRLESGRVTRTVFAKEALGGFEELRWDELVLLLEGINPKVRRRKRYNPEVKRQ